MIRVVNRHHYDGTDAVYVGRGTPLGNPYSHQSGTTAEHRVKTRAEAIEKYREWLKEQLGYGGLTRKTFDGLVQFYVDFGELTLACSCVPEACHAEVIRDLILEYVEKRKK